MQSNLIVLRLALVAAFLLPCAVSTASAEDAGGSGAAWAREGRPLPEPEWLQPRLDKDLPAYQPCSAQPLQGSFEGSASAIMPQLVHAWVTGFHARQPGVSISVPPPYLAPQGDLSPPMHRFLDGDSDFAFVSRDMTASDVAAFRRAHGMAPQAIPVVGGAYRHFGFLDTIGVVVNDANPVKGLTLAQLDAIFSRTRLRGHGPVRTWGDLGVAEWGDKPIHVVGAAAWEGRENSARAVVVRERVLSVGPLQGQWRDDVPVDGTEAEVPKQVAADPYAIGFTGMGHLAAGIKTVPLAQDAGKPFVDVSYENVALARYPLSRVADIVLTRWPGRPLDPALREFVRFILSREGQQIALDQGVMLPLRAAQANDARRLLVASGSADGCDPVAGVHAAEVDPDLPHYQPATLETPKGASYLTPDGAIAIVGYNDMQQMLDRQVARFAATHPGIRVSLNLPGTRFAPAALARGQSAIAPMGAEFTPQQLADYRAVTGSDPIEFRVAHASLDPRALSGPLAVFVHRDNPIGRLTLEQLAQAYTGKATRWGDLGAQGDWAARPIHLYGVERGTPLAQFMQKAGLGGQTFAHGMTEFHQSADVVRHMSEDPLAIGYAAAMRTTPSVRALALARHAGEEPVALTEENIMSGRYPLDRQLLIYVRQPLNSFAREFLRLVLSREGQEAVAASPQGYLPLSEREAAIERAKLD